MSMILRTALLVTGLVSGICPSPGLAGPGPTPMSLVAPPPCVLPQEKAPPPPPALGEVLEATGFLRDVRGNRRSLEDLQGERVVVLAFLGTTCPMANRILPRLVAMEQRYRVQGVRFLGIYANENEMLPEIAAHAADHDVPFLVLKDLGQRLADAVGAARTPTLVVLDGERTLRYRGRLDDQQQVAAQRAVPTTQDLAQALDELLAGEVVTRPETPVDGCLLDRTAIARPHADVTWARDVAPIVADRCQDCHRPGQIGPFPLLDFEDVVRRKGMVREVVSQRRMPPWHADDRHGVFANDRRLSAQEVATVNAWMDQGMPFGDEAELPAPRQWNSHFHLQEPDLVIASPEPFDVPAEGLVDYVYQETHTDYEEDLWVQEVEILPGDPSVLHHVLVYVMPPGDARARSFGRTTRALVNWVPGTVTKVNPEGTATRIPKGSTLLWELHYTTTGKATTDHTSMALRLSPHPPLRETRFQLFANFRIQVPPGAQHHREEATLRFREDVRLISLRPHMHLRGKSWRYEAEYPDGRTEVLLNVPNWDFNWQTEYFFDEPVALPKGTAIHAVAHWDNSDLNPLNPDPTRSVRYGLQTDQEMMNGWVKYVYERPLEDDSAP